MTKQRIDANHGTVIYRVDNLVFNDCFVEMDLKKIQSGSGIASDNSAESSLLKSIFEEMIQFRKCCVIGLFFVGALALWAQQFLYVDGIPVIHNFAGGVSLSIGVFSMIFHKRLGQYIEHNCRQRILENPMYKKVIR